MRSSPDATAVPAKGQFLVGNQIVSALANFPIPVSANALLTTPFVTPGSASAKWNAASSNFDAKAVSGVLQSATTADVRLTITSHPFLTGDIVNIAGFTDTGLDVLNAAVAKVTKIDANTISLDGTGSASGGAIDVTSTDSGYTSGATVRMSELWLAPPATEKWLVQSIAVVNRFDASTLATVDAYYGTTALTNGMTIKSYNTRTPITAWTAAPATDARTALLNLTPETVKYQTQWADNGWTGDIFSNSTDAAVIWTRQFPHPLILQGDLYDYLALNIGDDLNFGTNGGLIVRAEGIRLNADASA